MGIGWLEEWTGISMPQIDLSGSLSMGRVIPGLEGIGDFFQRETEPDRAIADFTEDVGGAGVSYTMGVLRAISDNNPDVWKRYERAMPAALKSLSRALRFHVRGEETTRTGARIASFEDPMEKAEIIAQALGFPPTRIGQRWEQVIAKRETEKYWMVTRQMFLADLDLATRMRDREGIADSHKAIREFNNRVRGDTELKRFVITRKVIRQSLKQRARARAREEAGLARTNIATPLARGIQQSFPTIEDEKLIERVR